MMQQLLLTEGQLINVKSATLPKGTYTKLQPVDETFLDLTNPKAVYGL
jgi:ubiquitin fusion degradation protein 1